MVLLKKPLPFSSSCIGRHDHALLPVVKVLPDPLEDGGLGVQVVHGDIEKTLQGTKGKDGYKVKAEKKDIFRCMWKKCSHNTCLTSNVASYGNMASNQYNNQPYTE